MLTAYFALIGIALALFALAWLYNRSTSLPVVEPVMDESESSEAPSAIEMTSEAQFVELTHGDGLVLVDFYATWCGPCNTMHPTIEKLGSMRIKDLKVAKVDIDYLRSVASLYHVRSVPTLMLFKKGELVWRYSGVAGLSELKTIISKFQEG